MSRTIKWLLFAILLATLSEREARASTVTATSCNVSDVQTAINAAKDGDTVIIPNGSCSWSSGISTSKQITVQGQSVGGVTITDVAGPATLLSFTIGGSFHTTIANLRFMPGTGTGNYIGLQGTGLPPLMHDVYFNVPNFQLQHAVVWGVQGGVIWNMVDESTQNLGGACGTQVGSDSGNILVKPPGNTWDDPSTMGALDVKGDKNLYIEDSTFSYVGQAPDGDDNSRIVIRHSNIIASSGLTHGTQGYIGARHVELYDNQYTYPAGQFRALSRYFWLRGGTLVVTGNNIQTINAGSCYPNKSSLMVIVEVVRWNDAGHGCCTGNQCFHQAGTGSNGSSGNSLLSTSQLPYDTYQIADPVYVWNNAGTGAGSSHYSTNDVDPAQDNCHIINPATGQEWSTADVYKSGRDYFYDDSQSATSGAKPGWVRYTYPHPLRGSSSTTGPAAPTNLNVTVQ